ncbi:NAD(P)H-binding protein [Streptomyces lunalinharesii]|uniref:SDR family oxidoreductase n=1 Tax=Streptomyces lunalinharesii TaxID=333384 RepID=A0ABN3SQX1_9ACTN
MILVTGAAGSLGGLVLQRISRRADVVAASRTPELVQAEVPVRRIDFDDPSTLAKGFAGAHVVLLVSAGYGEDDEVIARHQAAIEAAERAGVGHIVYTSLTGSGDHLATALAHRWTERRLMAGRAYWTVLRNGLYAELSIPDARHAAATGRLTGPQGAGKLASVAREDLAAAAAVTLDRPAVHRNKIYELVGDTALGGADIARAVAAATGQQIAYEPIALSELRSELRTSGVPDWQIPMVVSAYANIAAGFLNSTESHLTELLGRAPRPALDVITAALGSYEAGRHGHD